MSQKSGWSAAIAAARDSIPIALGYFAVSLAFGLYCARAGLPTWLAAITSATNLSSSGQFAGITIIGTNGGYAQLALGVGLVNLRYLLMAISLGQRLPEGTPVWQRLVMAGGITDEIYALGMSRPQLRVVDYVASMPLPIIGWTAGTITGSIVGEVLPPMLQSSFGVLLYAMFIAIVVPVARTDRHVLLVCLLAAAGSMLLAGSPMFSQLDGGWRIIIVTVLTSAAGATFLPRPPASIGQEAVQS